MSSSISRQLVFWLAVPLMLLALCGALVHYFNIVAPGVIASDTRLKAAASALAAHLEFTPGVGALLSQPDAPPHLPPDSMPYAIRDARGHLLLGDAQLPAVTPNGAGGASVETLAMIQVRGRTARSLTARLDKDGHILLITVADDRAAAEPAARLSFMNALLWDFAQLDVTLVLVWFGIQLGLRPVKRLRDEIAARSPMDLRAIDETSVPRELAPVVVTLNRLFHALRASSQAQQQFITNTAHQLRTPITGLQAQLEILAAEVAADARTAPLRSRLSTLRDGIKQLAHSANQLLSLARADPSVNLAAKNESVALDEIVSEVVAKFFDRALASNIDLGVEAVPVAVVADPALLDDLLSNLVDNALKYTPSGGSITVITGMDHGRRFLAVEDTGHGIPEADRQRVRQRFYRMPNSPGHGSGLGLAIVEEITQLYGATLSIEAGSGGRGTRVMVRF